MKKLSKVLVLVLSAIMVLAMNASVFAQTVGTEADGKGSITISNAAKGETYTVYKLFDASVTGTEDGSISYTGTVPDSLKNYFQADAAGNIHHGKMVDGKFVPDTTPVKDLTAEEIAALTAWAATADEAAGAKCTSTPLVFEGLDYGYYVVTTTQGDTAISVNSTNPDVEIIDKNTTPPVNNPQKKADDSNVYIGQTVNYTVTFGTANYDGAKQIVKYEIEDTLPAYLEDVTVTSIKIKDGDTAVADLTDLGANFATTKKITIPWTENSTKPYGDNLYKNGATIEIKYSAKVGAAAAVDGNGNKNKVTITYTTDDGTPHQDTTVVEETIYTYAAALQKIDENKKPLAGATFAANGLTVTGTAGDYIVTAYDKESTTPGTTMQCDAQGQLVIRGLPSDETLTLTEVDAPDGYNKLTGTTSLTPVVTGKTITKTSQTIYYDENGKVTDEETETSYDKETYNVDLLKEATQIINEKGTELPATGGIGTTIFYILGSLLVIGCGIVLISRRRMEKNN